MPMAVSFSPIFAGRSAEPMRVSHARQSERARGERVAGTAATVGWGWV